MTRPVRVAAARHAIFRALGGDGGGVVLHLKTTAYFRLNPVGAAVWQIVQEPTTFDALVARLRPLFDDAPPDLEQDIGRFVDELARRDLVVVEQIS